MDLIMAQSMTLDLSDDLKAKYETKIGRVFAEYQTEIETFLIDLLNEDQELTLTQMQTAVGQMKTVIRAKEAMELKYLVTIGSVDPKMPTLMHWVERCYNRFCEVAEGKDLAEKQGVSIDAILESTSKTKLH